MRSRKSARSAALAALRELDLLKFRFDRTAGARKQALLRMLQHCQLDSSTRLKQYHDLLSVVRAYPQSPAMLRAAERELERFHLRVAAYKQAARDPHGRRLINSGLALSAVVHPFTLEAVDLLMQAHRGRLEFEWNEISDEEANRALDFLGLLFAWPESDAYDYDEEGTAQSWLRRAADRRARTDLERLVALMEQSTLPRELARHFYDKLDWPVRWELGRSQASRTLQRLPCARPFYQNEPRRARTRDLWAELARPATPLERLSPREGARMVRVVQEVLYVRYRELFPITFANPGEVYRNAPGRGLEIYLYGMLPAMRLPLEANFGALLVRNGMPVGYGIGAPLLDRTEIAINIFPAYRAGESAYIFEQFFRIFYHHFGCRTFIVRSHQMGEDDDEPLLSGAFWFYYKLGFRATNPEIRRRAEQMAAILAARPRHRFSLAELKRLSHTDVFFQVDRGAPDRLDELSFVDVSYAATDYFARSGGNRQNATALAVGKVRRALKIGDFRRWSTGQVTALERWSPLLVQIPGLARWPDRDKAAVVRIVRAKGGAYEREYVLRLQRCARLRAALGRLAARARPRRG
jgi:hypothetical protein